MDGLILSLYLVVNLNTKMAESVMTKEEKQWNKQLTQHLDSYYSLRDWSELAAWLARLKNQFS